MHDVVRYRRRACSAVRFSSLISMPMRVVRSTSVATALAPFLDDQVSLPVARNCLVIDLGGAFGDVDHPED